MFPDAVILQNTKKKSDHTYTMYIDNEVEGRFMVGDSLLGKISDKRPHARKY